MGIHYCKESEITVNRFFARLENVYDNYIIIDGSDVNHIKNVLRMKPGEELMIIAGNNTEYLCSINDYENDIIRLDIVESRENDTELGARIHLFQGLPKGDKMELIIQKCVELGVHEIIPVAMKRCVVKLDNKKAASKISRWQAISESAAKQSKRTIVPKIHDVMNYKDAVEYAMTMDLSMVPYELAEGMEATKNALSKIKKGMDVAVFIGPEGGFDMDEILLAKDSNMTPVSLGRRILRTETAGFTVMAIIMYQLEIQE